MRGDALGKARAIVPMTETLQRLLVCFSDFAFVFFWVSGPAGAGAKKGRYQPAPARRVSQSEIAARKRLFYFSPPLGGNYGMAFPPTGIFWPILFRRRAMTKVIDKRA